MLQPGSEWLSQKRAFLFCFKGNKFLLSATPLANAEEGFCCGGRTRGARSQIRLLLLANPALASTSSLVGMTVCSGVDQERPGHPSWSCLRGSQSFFLDVKLLMLS